MLRLKALGQWMSVNGDALYGTTPWLKAGETLKDGTPVRYRDQVRRRPMIQQANMYKHTPILFLFSSFSLPTKITEVSVTKPKQIANDF
jgi:alpha-L-fucosidase